MRTIKFVFTIILVCSFVFITGCEKSDRPADLPPLFPCLVTITQEGVPLEGAWIELIPLDQTDWKWRNSAMTDAAGTANLLTYGFPGSPHGKFKIVVTKNIDDDFVYKDSPYGDGTKEVTGYKTYAMVEKKYSQSDTTPLEIEITGKTTQTFDIGKVVKIKL